ncbi:MAG: PAS domain-containing protein, partial [Candidatus Kapabacteria bacterium]|nr:PAS domain-containing protein [Candidatus Kapabacteria bacterium]
DVMMYNVLKRDIKKWYKSIYACVEGVNRFDWDMNVVTNAGERKIFHIMGKVAADEFGNIVKIVGTAQDITERTKIQEQLQRANTVVENSTSVLFRWEHNPDWQMTYISTNVKQWGYEPEQLVGSNEVISQFVHPDDIEQLVNNVNQHHAAHNTRYTLEYRLRNSNNEYRWVEERDFVTVDGDNRIVKIEGIITDINDRKVAEVQLQSKMLELHRQDYLLKVTAESLKQIVTTAEDFDAMMERAIGQIAEAMDTDRIFMYETTQIENTEETLSALQYSWSRIEQEPHEVFKNILPKRLGLDEIAVQMLNGKIFRQNLDVINTKAKRLLKMYGVQSIVAIPIFLRNKFWGFIMMHDCNTQREWLDFEINVLTGAAASMAGSIERNRAERKLKEYAEYLKDAKSKLEVQAHELLESNRELLLAREVAETSNKAKSAFLSSMSHELRTPLNAVLGFTQILKKDEQLNKQHHKYLDTMYNSGQHLLAMINDILDVSKIEAGKIELQLDHVSIENFCTELRSMFQVRCTEKQLSYSVSLRQSVPDYIRADVVRLRQVMINLIGNAVKFTPPGGSVAVVIDCVGTSNNSNEAILRFEVRDTGRGIPDNQLKTIFEPFRQVNGMYSEGTGLGLAISSKLVSLMQGDLRVQSTINAGSVFSF